MNMLARRGFTIIEVMLFLAVSGVMVVVLLGGWTVMINTQRYKDSVDTVYGYLQDQYNLVYNVENERDTTLTCNSSAEVVPSGGGGADSRGQSDCVLMGRFIKMSSTGDGTVLRSYAVVGRSELDTEPAGGDTAEIESYQPRVVTQSIGLSQAEQVVPWGAVIRGKVENNDPLNISILLLRSPTSGVVHRYIVDTEEQVEPVINEGYIDIANEQEAVTLCFDPGAIVQGGRQAVMIREYASSRQSVEIPLGDNGC